VSSPAILTLIGEAGSCQFTWQPAGTRPGPALLLARQPWSPEADRAQRAELDRAARLLGQGILRPAASVQGATWTTADPLLLIARLIYNRLPAAIMQALRELPAGSSLLIDTSDPELPWELAHDGEDYLALKYAVARQFLLPQPPRRNPGRSGHQFASLIIGNPTGDLPAADREVDELVSLIEATPGTAPPRILMRRRATRSAVLGELAGGAYDLIHFSGHAVLPRISPSPAHGRGAGGEGASETGGLILARDEVLSGAEIEQNLGGRPFVFLNGCETARGRAGAALTDGPDGLVYLGPSTASLAAAFVQGGARAALGAIWPVADPSAPDFVGIFYQAALRGTPAGEAVRQARRAVRAADAANPLWASFMFYGDPDAPLLPPPRTVRRPATVLVARLVGLDALSAGPGAEKLAARLEEQAAGLRAQIVRFGGQPQDLAHDLLIGAFGVPATRENDAERAVHAALAMAESTRQEGRGIDGRGLSLALGLSSGDVQVGNAPEAPPGERRAATLLGEAVNQAAWLARLAGDGVILAAEPVRRLTGSLFELVAWPAAQPEGAASFAVYQVLGTRAGDVPRWQAPGYQAPLIGRARELEELQDAWRLCRQGRGQVVSVVGEAGSGKSRLLHEFRRGLGDDGIRWLAAACPSSHAPGPYELVADLMRCLLGLAPALDGPDVNRQLREALARGLGAGAMEADLTEDVAILGEILAVPLRGLPQLQVEPRARQRRIVNLLGKLLARQAAEMPLIVTLDDLHWADEASLAVLNQMVGGFERLPLLLVALFRAEAGWQPPWWNRPSHRRLRLDALPEDEAAALLSALLAPEGLPADLTQAILDRAGGNPFFLRELALAVRESASLPEADGARSLAPLPSTVRRLILTRIDALPEAAQRVLPMAAVAGDWVDVEVLAAALAETGGDAALDEGLLQLEAREFLYHRWGEPGYRFTHALLREVAYDALAADARPRVHLCLGRALERVYAGREVETLDLLAHHFDRSDDRRSALRYCLWAARRAADAWANTIALNWYNRALDWIESFAGRPPDEVEQERGATPEQILRWRVEALEGQAGVQAAVGHLDEAIAGYTLALELVAGSTVFAAPRQADLYRKLAIASHDRGDFAAAETALVQGLAVVGEQPCLEAGRLHVWRGLLRFRRGELAEALVACSRGIAILAQADSPQDLAQAYNLQGLVYRNMGESRPAVEAHERSIALYAAVGDSAGLERATSNLGCVYQDLSRWPEASRCFERSAELAERTGEAWRQAAAAINLGEIYRRQGELERAIAAYERARQIGDEFGFPEVMGMAQMNLGASYLKRGELVQAGERLEAGLATFRLIGTDVYLPEILRYQAEFQLRGGHADEALLLAQQAVDWAVKLERRLELGQAQCILGQVYRALERPAEAETFLQESLSILDAQGSPYETALTLVELARLMAAQVDEASHAQARSTCDRAIAIFDQLGARLDAARARDLRRSL
jgi:adenylate cyclase